MEYNGRIPLLSNFWFETDREKDPVLYQDQLGWQEIHMMESGGYTEDKDIWQHLIGFSGAEAVGWDLGFFYLPNQTFYYLDQMAKVIYKLPIEGKESEPLFGRVNIRPQIVPEEYEIFNFDNIAQVWDDFTIDGHHMPYILKHSVLVLST